jgi:transcription initiation factor IIE alpha subunit
MTRVLCPICSRPCGVVAAALEYHFECASCGAPLSQVYCESDQDSDYYEVISRFWLEPHHRLRRARP